MHVKHKPGVRMDLRWISAAVVIGLMSCPWAAGQNLLDADPNSPTFNNPSFERPDIASVSPTVDVWVEAGPTIDAGLGFPILAGVGVFENPPEGDPSRLENMHGPQ